MNLLGRLNGIYSAKSEVPINWLVAVMPLTFSRISPPRSLLTWSTRDAMSQGDLKRRLGRVFRGVQTLAPEDRHTG